LHPMVEEEVYRIAREALANAFRHAGATEIDARICYFKGEFQAFVRDNGRGINPEILQAREQQGHWGLEGMRERAQRIGGTLTVTSSAGSGTEIAVRIPAPVAYRNSHRTLAQWLRRWFGPGFSRSIESDD
jgi:signal transduction histidine kinase